MNGWNKWWIAGAGALIVAGVLGVGAVMAQEETPSAEPTTGATQETPVAGETPSAVETPSAADEVPADESGPGRGGCGAFGANVEELASFLGTTVEELRTELQADGASLASVAEAHGQSRDALKSFMTTQATERLSEKVAEGRLTQAEADARLAEFTANLDAAIDASPPRFHGGFHFKGPRGDGDEVPAEPSSSS